MNAPREASWSAERPIPRALSGRARVAGVIGWPVRHSLSPRLHGYWLALHGVDGAYVPFATPPERFADALRALPALGLAGVNVTLPHKESAAALVDRRTPAAERIGAVNTVVVDDDGSLTGDNTDAFGFLAHLTASAPAWRADAGPAVVVGAGGAARAIVYALAEAGAPVVRVVNRTVERARALVAATTPGTVVEAIDWRDRLAALTDASVVVNTTTEGMAGRPPLDLTLDGLPGDAVVCDIVYTPLDTPLLREAAARGLTRVDGLGMLLHQARPGFARWFGTTPEVTPALRAFLTQGTP